MHHGESVLKWFKDFGQHLTRLYISHIPVPLQQLACSKLQALTLEHCSTQLGPAADGHQGVIQDCTNLTRLEVCLVDDLSAQTGSVDSLSSLVHLQHLEWWPSPHVEFSGGTLSCLTQLTYLETTCSLSAAFQLQLSTLPSLLVFIYDRMADMAVDSGITPGLALPASLTKLVGLEIVEVEVLSTIPAELKSLSVMVEGPIQGPRSLFAGMAQLQHLTALELYADYDQDWPLPGPAYSALTASSNLVSLQLSCLTPAQGVWPFVFPAAHKLQHLTCLSVAVPGSDSPSLRLAWDAAGLSSLVTCCPNLSVIADIALHHGPHVSELHKLTALTCLNVKYSSGNSYSSSVAAFQESLKGLAAVIQLQDLRLRLHGEELTMFSLLPLTSLTALTALRRDCNDPLRLGDLFTQVGKAANKSQGLRDKGRTAAGCCLRMHTYDR
jgi:hypothetical protein